MHSLQEGFGHSSALELEETVFDTRALFVLDAVSLYPLIVVMQKAFRSPAIVVILFVGLYNTIHPESQHTRVWCLWGGVWRSNNPFWDGPFTSFRHNNSAWHTGFSPQPPDQSNVSENLDPCGLISAVSTSVLSECNLRAA